MIQKRRWDKKKSTHKKRLSDKKAKIKWQKRIKNCKTKNERQKKFKNWNKTIKQ